MSRRWTEDDQLGNQPAALQSPHTQGYAQQHAYTGKSTWGQLQHRRHLERLKRPRKAPSQGKAQRLGWIIMELGCMEGMFLYE